MVLELAPCRVDAPLPHSAAEAGVWLGVAGGAERPLQEVAAVAWREGGGSGVGSGGQEMHAEVRKCDHLGIFA